MTDLITSQPNTLGFLETETVNINVAMAGLSTHTRRAYRRWITRYLKDINQLDSAAIDLNNLNISLVTHSMGTAQLKVWLGRLKEKALGKQSITQAKAAIVWIAGFMADIERLDYSVAKGLSKVKTPRAEVGQRSGTWLTQDEIKQLLRALRQTESNNPPLLARNTAIIILMVTCGLRRDEISTAKWSDLGRQGGNRILRVHGKGEKLRVVKLPAMVEVALDIWRDYHPSPEGDRAIFSRVWRKRKDATGGTVTTDPITDRAIWMIVQNAAKSAGLQRVSPHDLRRSFARGAYEAGVSFELIRQSLGHSNIATTERYVNSVLELDRAATDIWANSLDEDD